MISKVKRGCPLCKRMVVGDTQNKYFCKHCNILFNEKAIRKPKPKKTKTGIKREKGYLYFIDKQGDVSRVKMAKNRADKGKKKHEKVLKAGIKKEKGYLYYIDKKGNIARSPMKRGKKKPKKQKDIVTQKIEE